MWFSVVCTLIDNGTRHHKINVKENIFFKARAELTRAAWYGLLSTMANKPIRLRD